MIWINRCAPICAKLKAQTLDWMMPMNKLLCTATRIGTRLLSSAIGTLACLSTARAAEPTLRQLTNAIDIKTAVLCSVISILLLLWLRRADYKSPFGIWGGRFIIFILVVSNIFLWTTQI
jgi:hypothetical protein